MATATKQPPTKDANNASVRVEIFDQPYNLRGTDPDYILKLADYVDSKMRAVAEQTHTVDTSRVAVLAALNIADELLMIKRNHDTGSSEYAKRAQHLADALDEVLKDKDKDKAQRRAG
jgi:cell division protein ZapA